MSSTLSFQGVKFTDMVSTLWQIEVKMFNTTRTSYRTDNSISCTFGQKTAKMQNFSILWRGSGKS